LCSSASGQVVNGDFDDFGGALTGWDTFNNGIPNVTTTTDTPLNGTYAAKVFGGFNGDPNFSGLLQNLTAEGSQTWTACVEARHNTGDSLAGSNTLSLKVEFYNVAGGTYGTSDMLAEHAIELLNSGSPTDAWTPYMLEVVAPVGTVEARVAFVFSQIGNAAGAALIDGVTFASDAPPEEEEWVLIWSDEFDGTSLNLANWEHMIGDGSAYGIPGWGNNELQYYTDRPENVTVSGGNLSIIARQENFAGHSYTSARLRTRNKQDFLYGRLEARIKLPDGGQGIWPAFWMLPTPSTYGGWAASGEIDIMETVNVPTTIHGTIHHGGQWPGNTSTGGSTGGFNFSDDFHVYAIEWDPDQIRWYLDGVQYFVVSSSTWFSTADPGNARAPFDLPFHFLLNVAVGGNWPGPPDGSTTFPTSMMVDWVRVSTRVVTPGEPLLEIVDTTPEAAVTDGTVNPDEYVDSTNGINVFAGDRIGANSEVHVDSGTGARLSLGINSASGWPSPSSWGVVIYIDSVPGGYEDTIDLSDISDMPQRLASAKGSSGESADLIFAPDFDADFAICLESDRVTILQLGQPTHTIVSGAMLGAATDFDGGTDVVYRTASGGATDTQREIQLQLAHLGLQPTEPFDFIATLLGGNTAFRTDQFVGVLPGNPFDGSAIGANLTILKGSDYIRFTSVFGDCNANTIRDDCDISCGTPGGDCDVPGCGLLADANGNGLPDTCDPPPVYGDTDNNFLVDLLDINCIISGFGDGGASCANGDIYPCTPNGAIDIDDVLAVLDAFAGNPACTP
jgi:beta-glucanase (GH16 family)